MRTHSGFALAAAVAGTLFACGQAGDRRYETVGGAAAAIRVIPPVGQFSLSINTIRGIAARSYRNQVTQDSVVVRFSDGFTYDSLIRATALEPRIRDSLWAVLHSLPFDTLDVEYGRRVRDGSSIEIAIAIEDQTPRVIRIFDVDVPALDPLVRWLDSAGTLMYP